MKNLNKKKNFHYIKNIIKKNLLNKEIKFDYIYFLSLNLKYVLNTYFVLLKYRANKYS